MQLGEISTLRTKHGNGKAMVLLHEYFLSLVQQSGTIRTFMEKWDLDESKLGCFQENQDYQCRHRLEFQGNYRQGILQKRMIFTDQCWGEIKGDVRKYQMRIDQTVEQQLRSQS